MFVCLWTLLHEQMAKEVALTDKSLLSCLVFVSVAVRHFTRSDAINQYETISINHHNSVTVFAPWLPTLKGHSSLPHYIFVYGHIFPHYITNGAILGKGLLNRGSLKVSHSKKNSGRYCKCA
jgi:hypothetical protein